MSETLDFFNYSRYLISKRIVPFSFSTEDSENSLFLLKTIENFLFDSELCESIDITNSPIKANSHKFDHFQYSEEQIYRPRMKLERSFWNFIKEFEISKSPEKAKNPKKCHIRSYSAPLYNAERLVNLHCFLNSLKRALKKVMWEMTYFLRELRQIYRHNELDSPFYEENISIIRAVCDLMSQFFIASLFELRHNKCRKIIEELENLSNISNQFKVPDNIDNIRKKTISPHFIKKFSSVFPTNSLNQSLDEIIPNYFKESEKFIDVPLIQKSKNINGLRCFEKLKYILAEVAHIIHYNTIPFELSNFINPEKENSYFLLLKTKFKNKKMFEHMAPSIEFAQTELNKQNNLKSEEIYFSRNLLSIYYNLKFLNEIRTDSDLMEKIKTLEHYFVWKAQKWLSKTERKASGRLKLKCKICLNDVSSSIMNKHSELCMKKKKLTNDMKNQETNFQKFIAFCENLIRNQKTIYRIEKASLKKTQGIEADFRIKLKKADHHNSVQRSSTIDVTNSLSSNNILEKKTCPMKSVGPPKLSLHSFGDQERKMIGMFLDDKKAELNEQEDHDESFLDSPDTFIFNLEEEKEKEKKPSSLFFKREFSEKNLTVVTHKAFSDYKDSSTSSDSETKLMTKKLAETAKCKACADKKVSKFKPPITQMHDEPESSKYKFFEPSFKSQKDVKNLEKMELEKCEKIKEKELKLKEKYYLIKMYMIIQKTAVLFSKNPMDTKIFLKVKETLKELEKYQIRLKNQEEALKNLNNYKDYLTEYLGFYYGLQDVIKEMDLLEKKDFSAVSHKSHDKNSHLFHYDSDSNSQFLGTPPRRSRNNSKVSPPNQTQTQSIPLQLEKIESMKRSNEQLHPHSLFDQSRAVSFQERDSLFQPKSPLLNLNVPKNCSEICIKIPVEQTPPNCKRNPYKKTVTDLRPRRKKPTLPNTLNLLEIFSPIDMPKSKKKMDSSKNLSLRKKLREKTKKPFSAANLFSKNSISLQKNESMYPQKSNVISPTIPMDEFAEVLNEEEEFLIDHFLSYHPGYYSDSYLTPKAQHIADSPENALSIKDFECLRLINKGAFGRVWLVKRKSTNDLYAMKIVNILDHIINKKDTKFLEAECKIYDALTSEFVVRALFQFTHETFLCFVTEYMIGGDFGYLLHEYKCLDESVAKFYIAELILAIDSLHASNIIHRDLKPDNILLDAKGHIKLTDFGLSKLGVTKKTQEINSPKNISDNNNLNFKLKPMIRFLENDKFQMKHRQTSELEMQEDLMEKNHSKILTPLRQKLSSQNNFSRKHRAIGTPDYMAPEILNGSDNWMNSPSVDWWALGVMIFEFIVGVPPFNDSDWKVIFENILQLAIPWDQLKIGEGEDCMSEEAADLIKKMLVLDPEERITKNGSAELKQHRFFLGIDWDILREQTAPIIPSRDLDLMKDDRKFFSEIEKNDPFFTMFETIRESDENLKKAKKKAHELLPAPKENLGALNEKNIQEAKEVNQKLASESDMVNSPLFDEYTKQRMINSKK